MKINYVLMTFSPAMFGEAASSHIRVITKEEAECYVSNDTKIVATRVSHDRLARNQFPVSYPGTSRYAQLKPGVNAIHIHYRGPQVPETGEMPAGAMVTFYLIEVEEYQPAEAA